MNSLRKKMSAAKINKKDEFYTRLTDIEKELKHYLDINPKLFNDKTVLCPCDNPMKSKFTQYFLDNFDSLGLKRLISTGYNAGTRGAILDTARPSLTHLEGEGDFRDDEMIALKDECDFIITNPPFSLFRDFFDWCQGKSFIVIGHLNACTYKNIYPSICSNQVSLGYSKQSTNLFRVPETYLDGPTSSQLRIDGADYIKVSGIIWFTNLKQYDESFLELNTMTDNLLFNKRLIKKLNYSTRYQYYDNYEAIDVPFTNAIPSDYAGVMGVPITFLDKYNPKQFKIIGFWNSGESGEALGAKKVIHGVNKQTTSRTNGPVINGKASYFRILIKHK